MSKRVKKETLPFIVAILMLFLLIGALVYTILYKPKENVKVINESTLTTEDLVVNNKATACGDYDIAKLSEDAKGIKISYEVLDNISTGAAMVIDAGNTEDEYVNTYGYGLRIKISGLSDNMFIRIKNRTLNTTNDYYKNDIDNRGYIYDDTYNLSLQYLDIKVLINDENCKDIILREFETTLPKFNELLRGGVCTTDEYKDRDICKPYIFNDDSYETQLKNINKEVEKVEKEKKTKEEKKDEEKGKKWIVIVIVAIIAIVVTVAGVIVMKGSKKHEKK